MGRRGAVPGTALALAVAVSLVLPALANAHKLNLVPAQQAAQAAADAFAGQPTQLNSPLRTGKHSYYFRAKWQRPGPPPYFSEVCGVDVTVTIPRRGFTMTTTLDDFACY